MQAVVAIDGPSGSGKGTMARGLASHFSFEYLDTGLMYRTLGFAKVSYDDLVNFTISDYNQLLLGFDEIDLRKDEVSALASSLGADPRARIEVTRLQRDFISEKNSAGKVCVLDGRDIGTVVAPNAFCKFFITADLEIRAKRRFDDLKKTADLDFDDVLKNLKNRDEQDKNRKCSPLKLTDDYIVIDTSNCSVDECLCEMKAAVIKRMNLIHRN